MSGDLFRRARDRAEHARRVGVLAPIETRAHAIDDGGARFVVRVVSSLAAKERARAPAAANPFLPYDEDLFVAGAGADHVLLLNKFPVVADHLLLVTRAFEDQESLLTRADFGALFDCAGTERALAFYNAGAIAGASQRHKHLQLVPLPLDDGDHAVPLEPLYERGAPFAHAFEACPSDPGEAHALYLALLARVGAERAPYNLLMTPEWMLVVPRSRERFDSISVNALGFAGSILVKNDAQLARVREVGPLAILRHVAR